MGYKRPLKSQYQGLYDGQLGRPRSRQHCLNSSRSGTHASGGNGIIAHVWWYAWNAYDTYTACIRASSQGGRNDVLRTYSGMQKY
jgi:hypothetical protein